MVFFNLLFNVVLPGQGNTFVVNTTPYRNLGAHGTTGCLESLLARCWTDMLFPARDEEAIPGISSSCRPASPPHSK